jgi:hypothetical protein
MKKMRKSNEKKAKGPHIPKIQNKNEDKKTPKKFPNPNNP